MFKNLQLNIISLAADLICIYIAWLTMNASVRGQYLSVILGVCGLVIFAGLEMRGTFETC